MLSKDIGGMLSGGGVKAPGKVLSTPAEAYQKVVRTWVDGKDEKGQDKKTAFLKRADATKFVWWLQDGKSQLADKTTAYWMMKDKKGKQPSYSFRKLSLSDLDHIDWGDKWKAVLKELATAKEDSKDVPWEEDATRKEGRRKAFDPRCVQRLAKKLSKRTTTTSTATTGKEERPLVLLKGSDQQSKAEYKKRVLELYGAIPERVQHKVISLFWQDGTTHHNLQEHGRYILRLPIYNPVPQKKQQQSKPTTTAPCKKRTWSLVLVSGTEARAKHISDEEAHKLFKF